MYTVYIHECIYTCKCKLTPLIIPLLENLEIGSIFKDEAKREEDSIIDALSIIL